MKIIRDRDPLALDPYNPALPADPAGRNDTVPLALDPYSPIRPREHVLGRARSTDGGEMNHAAAPPRCLGDQP